MQKKEENKLLKGQVGLQLELQSRGNTSFSLLLPKAVAREIKAEGNREPLERSTSQLFLQSDNQKATDSLLPPKSASYIALPKTTAAEVEEKPPLTRSASCPLIVVAHEIIKVEGHKPLTRSTSHRSLRSIKSREEKIQPPLSKTTSSLSLLSEDEKKKKREEFQEYLKEISRKSVPFHVVCWLTILTVSAAEGLLPCYFFIATGGDPLFAGAIFLAGFSLSVMLFYKPLYALPGKLKKEWKRLTVHKEKVKTRAACLFLAAAGAFTVAAMSANAAQAVVSSLANKLPVSFFANNATSVTFIACMVIFLAELAASFALFYLSILKIVSEFKWRDCLKPFYFREVNEKEKQNRIPRSMAGVVAFIALILFSIAMVGIAFTSYWLIFTELKAFDFVGVKFQTQSEIMLAAGLSVIATIAILFFRGDAVFGLTSNLSRFFSWIGSFFNSASPKKEIKRTDQEIESSIPWKKFLCSIPLLMMFGLAVINAWGQMAGATVVGKHLSTGGVILATSLAVLYALTSLGGNGNAVAELAEDYNEKHENSVFFMTKPKESSTVAVSAKLA